MSSYTLDTGKKYIKDIFSADSFYNVPEYQRPYVWGKNQVVALLDDIRKAMERDKEKEYFLGCMVWNTKQSKEGDFVYTSQDILDGQQRFITLYLLQAVLRDLSKSKDLQNKIRTRMRQERDEFDGIPERNRIEFEIRKDKEFLEEYVLKKNGTKDFESLRLIAQGKDNDVSVKNMAAAILELHNWFQALSEEELDVQQYLKDFYAYLCTKVLIIYLSTPNNLDDAYNLFTVLNSRGLQLQASDILRAQNLRHIKDEGDRKDFAEKWEKYESAIDEPYNSFDEFLWSIVFITMKYRSDDNQNLNKAFEFMYGRNMLTRGEGTFEVIGRYSKHLQAITSNDICSSEVGNFFVNLNYILTKTYGNAYVAPLMHYRECFKEFRIYDFLIKLDNLCSAYWLTGKGNLQSRIFILLRKMEEISRQDGNIKDLASQFLDSPVLKYEYQDEKASTAVDIEYFLDFLDSEKWGEYAGQRINKTRYLLLKIDLLSGSLNSKIYFDSSTSSVEHLMPRSLGKTATISEVDHKKWVHRLGNIVLVDRKKNSSLSNKEFPDKKMRYKGSIENRANTNYIFMTYSEWNIETIRENHYRVFDLLKTYYLGNSFETVKGLLHK
ncbi:DUF262 domain-containing protein [Oculatella sp. FACHB-28]|uniref:DUF262 domain-containing protein n=1 Tax=Oculatella sp. FACHB-28 TaxID=2692845 RepID=UPI0016839AEB|nr:DUF262 domain-containing protein [Oculatella sp. FACHB-28]MBD2055314.1 DUF262 domain-containing protein [Oculatella sp. FACHB-28]